MAQLLETTDLTRRDQDGWTVRYAIHRDDGEEIEAYVNCTGSDEASIRAHAARGGFEEELAALDDRGLAIALERAERAQAGRGPTRLTINLRSPAVGGIYVDYGYSQEARFGDD